MDLDIHKPIGHHDDVAGDDVDLSCAISGLSGSARRKREIRTEPAAQISEFNINASAGRGRVHLHELMGALQSTTSHGEMKKQLKNIQRKQKTLDTPLSRFQQGTLQRQVAYDRTKEEVSKWDSVVNENRHAEQIVFPLEKPAIKVHTTSEFTRKIQPYTPLEREIAALLHGSEHVLPEKAGLTKAEQRALQAMDIEEAKRRRAELQKYRALLSYKEAKAKRQKKIKSKKFHRILNKQKRKREAKALDDLKEKDPEALNIKIQNAEKSRIQERMSLKHHGGSKKMRSKMIYAKFDKEARLQVSEMLQTSRDLRQKTVVDDVESEDEGPTPAPDEDDSPKTFSPWVGSSLSGQNPWLKPTKQVKPSAYARPKAVVPEHDHKDGGDNETTNSTGGIELTVPAVNKHSVTAGKGGFTVNKKANVLNQTPSDTTARKSYDTTTTPGIDSDEVGSANDSCGKIEAILNSKKEKITAKKKKLNNKKKKSKQVTHLPVINDSCDKIKAIFNSKKEKITVKKSKLNNKKKKSKQVTHLPVINDSCDEIEAIFNSKKEKITVKKSKLNNKKKKSKQVTHLPVINDSCDKIEAIFNSKKERITARKKGPNENKKSNQKMDVVKQSNSAKEKKSTKPKKKPRQKNSLKRKLDEDEAVDEDDEDEDDEDEDDEDESGLTISTERKKTLQDFEHLATTAARDALETRRTGSKKSKRPKNDVSDDEDMEPVSTSEASLDPKKFLALPSKDLRSKCAALVAEGDDSEQDVSQLDLIAEAFADDDVVNSFAKEKQATVNKDKPAAIDLTLPGWGNWGGTDIVVSKKKRQRFRIKPPPAAPRRDRNLKHVIISEVKDDSVAKHQVSWLPRNYKSVCQFQSKIRAPIGRTWNPETAFEDLIKPKVVTHMGTIINPMDQSQKFSKVDE